MIYEKLLEIQASTPTLHKDARNPHFGNTYVTLDTVLEKIVPLLNERGIVLIQAPDNNGPEPALRTILYDTEDGSSVEGSMPLVLERAGPQALGSAITYYRRYHILAMMGLTADEDDDGEKATARDAGTNKAVSVGGGVSF